MADKNDISSLPALSRIGQYRIIRKIGSGGSGEVYLCRHIVLDKSYAIKILSIPPGEQGAEIRGRVLREARIARSIRHRHLVPVLDANVSSDDNTAWIAMEYVDGETLDELLETAPLPESAALYVCRCVALVLAEAEKHNIVHRDIKPANILIDRAGNVKVTDLGIAKTGKADLRYDEPVTQGEKLLGTPDYASPEQLRDSSCVDIRADIYSLGATLYHMLSGRKPFEAQGVFNLMAQVLEADPPEISGINPATAALVKKMMSKDPQQRPQNARQLLSELRKVSLTNARQTSEIRKFLSGGARRIFSDENARTFAAIRNTFIILCAIASGVMICMHLFYEYGPVVAGGNISSRIISQLDGKHSERLRELYLAGKINAAEVIEAVAKSGNPRLIKSIAGNMPELITSPQYASGWLDLLSDKNSRPMLKTLLKYQFPVNAAKASAHLPAVFRKELAYDDELLRLLLANKLDASARDAAGRTALLRMARNPRASVKCAELLLKAGVPLNARDSRQANALLTAAHAGNPGLVRFLYRAGTVLTPEDISRLPDTYNLKHELLNAAKKADEKKSTPQKAAVIPVKKAVPAKPAAQKTAVKVAEAAPQRKASAAYMEAEKKELLYVARLKEKRKNASLHHDTAESQKIRRKIEVYLQTNPSGRLPLEGEKDFVESVINSLRSGKINPDIRTGKEQIHLLCSVAKGEIYPRKRLFRTLLDAGADPDSIPMPDDAKFCRMLVMYGRSVFAGEDLIKLLSSASPDWETARKMVLRGADPAISSRPRKENAFHRAAALGNTAFLELLLDSGKPGADAADAEGYTPYQLAVICGNDDAAKLLEKHGLKSKITPAMRNTGNLFNAVKHNDPGDTAYYLTLGTIPGQLNGKYRNALQSAVDNNCLEAAQSLLENGFPPDSSSGISALEAALKNKNEEMFNLLISHGADMQTQTVDRFGRNSLLFTAVFRYLNNQPDKLYNCFRTMLEKGWKWKNRTPDGDTPLSWMEKWNEGYPRIKELFDEYK